MIPIALPSKEFLTRLSEQFHLQSVLSCNFYASCLDVYHAEICATPKSRIGPPPQYHSVVVAAAILTATACNGLYLIKMYNISSLLTNCFLNILEKFKVDRDRTLSQQASRLLEFHEQYKPIWPHTKCNLMSADSRDFLWPWSRILDSTYFKNLRTDENSMLFAKMAYILDPDNIYNWRNSSLYKKIPFYIEEAAQKWHENLSIDERGKLFAVNIWY